MSHLNAADKTKRLNAYLSSIFALISEKKVVKFWPLAREHNCIWNSGACSVRTILEGKMKLISGTRGGEYSFTQKYFDEYGEMKREEMLEAITKKCLRQVESWVSKTREEKDPTMPAGEKGVRGEDGSLLVELTAMEVFALKELIGIAASSGLTPVQKLLVEQIKAKL